MQFDDVMDDLADTVSNDPNILFLRALAVLRQVGANKFALAHDLLQAAVAGGHPQAAVLLGILLVEGPDGVAQDLGQGKKLIETAAAAGDRMAQRAVGIGYLNGDFGALDPATGAGLLRRAADAGDPPAMLQYAFLLSTGAGVEKDTKSAEAYLRRAAAAGLTAAQETLGAWILNRYKSGFVSDPSEGIRWLKQAYEVGYSTNALVRLAIFYADDGRGKWRDRNKSFALFSLCAGFSSSHCQYGYAILLGARSDFIQAYAHFVVAQEQGATKAAEKLQAMQRILSPDEKQKAVELAKTIRGELHPIPAVFVFQYPGVRPPSPWPASSATAVGR